MKTFYLTTPIYYVNANPHLGHAYTTIVADSITRFHKMLGEKAIFLTGTDEHGDKIVQAAEKNNVSPQKFVDEISSHFRQLWPGLGIEEDFFVRTTDANHVKAVQDFLQRVYEAGDIYFGEFGGYYCYGCERFYTEKELQDGLCPQHLTKPQYISEKNYFFRMSKYLPWLKEYIENNPDLIRPERYRREALGMLNAGVLEDLCISRPKSRLTWGIELPFDSNYVCYVWFDALIAYISGIGWPTGEKFKEFWPGDHLIAKDILKPHAIFWPCMLRAAGIDIYKHLNVHGYWLSRDTKMSKSLGNVIDPLAVKNQYGLDAFRYFLLRDMSFGSDASFSEEALITRINADLANDLGNLFSRSLSMNAKYFGAQIPPCGNMNEDDQDIRELCEHSLTNYLQLFVNFEFAQALEALWEFVNALNKYVDTQAPWSLAKAGNTERLAVVINVLIASLHKIALCLWPVMPHTSTKMLEQLGEKDIANPPVTNLEQEARSFVMLPPGRKLASSSNLFPRINVKEKPAEKIVKEKTAKKPKEEQKFASIDTFKEFDIRVGTVKQAEKHPNADKILILQIDFGEGSLRQILSGLAEFYKPEALIGKKICAVLNLEPRKIRGIVSYGMVLTTEDKNTVTVLEADTNMTNGAKIS